MPWSIVDPYFVMGEEQWLKTALQIAKTSDEYGGALEQRLLSVAENTARESRKMLIVETLAYIGTLRSQDLLTPPRGWLMKSWLDSGGLKDAAEHALQKIHNREFAGGKGAISVVDEDSISGQLSEVAHDGSLSDVEEN